MTQSNLDNYETTASKEATRMGSNSGNNEHGTPITLVNKLKKAVGGLFDVDAASGAEPEPIARTTYTKSDNGLQQDWHGKTFLNPPYGQLTDKPWMEKVWGESKRDEVDFIICLLPGYTTADWFQDYIHHAELISLLDGRLTFHGNDQSASFPNILACFGNLTRDIADLFAQEGTIFTPVMVENATEQQQLTDLLTPDGGAVTTVSADTVSSPHPNSTPGPDINDYATTATTTTVFDLSVLSVGDEMYVELDDSMLGFPSGISSELSGRVLGGAPATPDHTQTPDDWNTVLCVDPRTETYFCLYQDQHTLTDMRCGVAPDGVGWETVYLNTIHRTYSSNGPQSYTHVQ